MWMTAIATPRGHVISVYEDEYAILPGECLIVISPGDQLENVDTKIEEPALQ